MIQQLSDGNQSVIDNVRSVSGQSLMTDLHETKRRKEKLQKKERKAANNEISASDELKEGLT